MWIQSNLLKLTACMDQCYESKSPCHVISHLTINVLVDIWWNPKKCIVNKYKSTTLLESIISVLLILNFFVEDV